MMKFVDEITEFIFLEDAPRAADAIVIPGNAYPQPSERAAMLYKQGVAPLVIPSGKYSKVTGYFPGAAEKKELYTGEFETESEFLSHVLTLNGVPDEAIIREPMATFTLENAQNVRRILEQKGIRPKCLIICCQAFHARRSKMYFEYVFADMDVEFLVCPAVTQGISRENWMESQRGLDLVLGELKRCGEQFGWMLKPQV